MPSYKFRVLLDNPSDQEIFRDIQINQNSSFEVFYHAILSSFGFQDDQMASFYVSNSDWDKGEEISLLDVNYDPDADPVGLMSQLNLKDRVEESDQKFILVHDFLSMWIFLVELQGESEDSVDEPKVLLSIGEAPDEKSRINGDDSEEFDFDDDFEDGYNEEDFDMDEFDEGFEQFDENDY